MNKPTLFFILIIDIIIIIGMSYVVYNRYKQYNAPKIVKTEKNIVVPETVQVPVKQTRNILFQYRSSKAQDVSIIGDFNDWTPQPLTKDQKNLWKIVLSLEPGEYQYNFLVNGKVITDPNNRKKTVNNLRGFKSSVLSVKPLDDLSGHSESKEESNVQKK